MLTKIVLGGYLGDRFGREHFLSLDSGTPAEAVKALSATVEGFRQTLIRESEPGYHVIVDGRDIAAEELKLPACKREITIMPALGGAKDGWFQVILGAVLIAAGAAIDVISQGALSFIGNPLIGLGISMVVGGAAQLLYSPPKAQQTPEQSKNTPSYNFNGPVNTIGQGHPVPICYGKLEVGSQVVSAGLVTENWTLDSNYHPKGVDGDPVIPGGACPAPHIPILLADRTTKPAGSLKVGDRLWTRHEHTGEWGVFEVADVEIAEAHRWRLEAPGILFVGSLNHRVLGADGSFREIRTLRPGELVGGFWAGTVTDAEGVEHSAFSLRPVKQIGPTSFGPVVRIEVKDAHTYVAGGVVSHNAKRVDPPAG